MLTIALKRLGTQMVCQQILRQYDSATGDYQAGDVTFSAPLQGMGFTGLVTFTSQNSISNGQQQSLSFGQGGTTTIDGG